MNFEYMKQFVFKTSEMIYETIWVYLNVHRKEPEPLCKHIREVSKLNKISSL